MTGRGGLYLHILGVFLLASLGEKRPQVEITRLRHRAEAGYAERASAPYSLLGKGCQTCRASAGWGR